MIKLQQKTPFLPAETAGEDRVRAQALALRQGFPFLGFLNGLPIHLLILNSHRQTVFANRFLVDFLDLPDFDRLLGQRPGEVLNCKNTYKGRGVCGTTEFCRHCGAAKVLKLMVDTGESGQDECRLLRYIDGRTEALDMHVWSYPLNLNGERFIIFAMMDISANKRREALERIFFHDLLNTAGALMGVTDMLARRCPQEERLPQLMQSYTRKLVEEIRSQRDLMAAESENLELHVEEVALNEWLEDLKDYYQQLPVAEGKTLVVQPSKDAPRIRTDHTLLGRVIGNMIKNALEASGPDDTITLNCRTVGERVKLSVHNPAVMPHNVQLQVFQRSFSTKGKGRGLGTYSMKLLSERFLKGGVDFESDFENGTTFYGIYPLSL